jgi:hypothetical protein
MGTNSKKFIVQNFFNGEWISSTPEKVEYLEDKEKAKKSLRINLEMEAEYGKGEKLQYRFAEFEVVEGELVPVGFYSPEIFETIES